MYFYIPSDWDTKEQLHLNGVNKNKDEHLLDINSSQQTHSTEHRVLNWSSLEMILLLKSMQAITAVAQYVTFTGSLPGHQPESVPF